LLAALPDDLARHPFMRQQRFKNEALDAPLSGGFNAYLERVRSAAASFAQSTADLQRYDTTLAGHSMSEHGWVQNTNVLSDQTIRQVLDDEARLVRVLRFDLFTSARFPADRRARGAPADFLASAPMQLAAMQAAMQAAPAPQLRASAPAPAASAAPTRLFGWSGADPVPMTDAQLQAEIAQHPTDMESRVALAMQMLKQGKSATEARGVIDGYPPNMRVDAQVRQSHVWSLPAHAFFFAGDMDNAKPYYQRVSNIGTGSGSELHARARLRQIEGDIPGMLTATSDRQRRYESDYSRRDLAGLLFMTGQKDQAWEWLTPRLASATTFQLWVGALVGQRADRQSLQEVKAWIGRQGLERAQINFQDTAPMYLHLYSTVDRLPTEGDIALLRNSDPRPHAHGRWVASAQLVRMALQGSYGNFDSVREHMAVASKVLPQGNRFMRPLFAWVAWHATAGKDPELEGLRRTNLATGDFDSLLAKAVLLGLAGQTQESLEFLRAARYQMSELGLSSPNVDRPVPSPYGYALAGYLLFNKTGNEDYRTETLQFARTHQKVFPFWGWSYALEALLERNEKSRAIAMCRATYLDAESHFLGLVKKKPASAACSKNLWAPPG
jgi:hypothetical protein